MHIKPGRTILHCDCNNYFASVELLEHPELRDKPVAVAGDPEGRHGIILAKNELAKRFNGEIISADSRQVYRHLDIGSGKDLGEYTVATAAGDRLQVPYHLIDVAQLPQEYSVYDYQRDAYQSIASILARGRLPVVVGGTGMYLDALVRGYDLVRVPTNEALRQELAGMSMDELAVLDGRKCILQLRGVRPFLSDKYDITKHPNYKYLSDADPKNAFDIGKFLSSRLKLKPDEAFEVYEVDVNEDMEDDDEEET